MSKSHPSWRDVLPIHPAADLFPLMSEAELRELGKDISRNGLQSPIVLFWNDSAQWALLDGRNRLDAMQLVGMPFELRWDPQSSRWHLEALSRLANTVRGETHHTLDPYEFVVSANIHRRHLTGEQKRELIAKLLKADPAKSNRQVATIAKVDHKTVGEVRREEVGRGEIPHVETRTDTKGRQQPVREKHYCWQCGARAPVGEVQEHSYSAYEGADVWLHDACIAAFEAELLKNEQREPDPDDMESSGDAEEVEVESPDKILANFLDTVCRHAAVLRAYKKVFGVSALDQAQKDKARAAIGRLVTKWQSLEKALAPPAIETPENDDGLDLPAFCDRRPKAAVS
jgi:hypothetical protein